MSTADDAYWRRPPVEPTPHEVPEPGSPEPAPPAGPPARLSAPHEVAARETHTGYQGPPVSSPPPPSWRPEFMVQPPDPRQLPPQDHRAIDEQEQSARSLTYGLGLATAGVLIVVVCLLCGRVFF